MAEESKSTQKKAATHKKMNPFSISSNDNRRCCGLAVLVVVVDSSMALCQLCNCIPFDKFISRNNGKTISLMFSN